MPWLGALLANLLGSAVARMLTGAGLGLVTFAALTPLVLSAMNGAAQKFSGIASSVLQIMLMSGFGVAISAVGSAIVTRIAIEATRVAIKKS